MLRHPRTMTAACGLLAFSALVLSPATGASASPSRAGLASRTQPTVHTSRASRASTLSATAADGARPGLSTLGLGGWQVQSTAATTQWTTGQGTTQPGAAISQPGFATSGWLPVKPDDAGAPGTEVEALLQSGVCPDDPRLAPVDQATSGPKSIFFSDNMALCFGTPMTSTGADTDPLFTVPWWFRTEFSASVWRGQDAKLVINGVVGQADVWLNGTEVATEATVEGDYTSYTFDITRLLRPGTNALAFELFPNNPSSMFTLDNVDWTQIPPDNNTGLQFPVQLHVADALGIANTYVTQDDAPDMSVAALTVHADVTNTTPAPQSGTVFARITPPGRGSPIVVAQRVSLPGGATRTMTFTPAAFRQLTVRHPELWWPYQMGGQPLYQLQAGVAAGHDDGGADIAPPVDFGVRTASTYLTPPTTLTPEGVRVFEVNGVPFDYRAGGWSENLFLHYSASDLANQVALIKSLGLNGIRTEGKQMPQDFYNQMDRAGILIDAGFQCCDKWQASSSGSGVTSQDYHVMYQSSLTIGEQLRDHPSVLNWSWSDNNPNNEQEAASLAGLDQSGFQEPVISSAEYNSSGILGPSGEKEGPYDWEPPSYWYDTTHSGNVSYDADSTLTNVGGAWGFDSEQSAGDTLPTMDSVNRFLSTSDQATLWEKPSAAEYHTNYEGTAHTGYAFGNLDNLDAAIRHRYGKWHSLREYVQEGQVQNYEDTRAQFEAYLAHWNNPTPSTGTDYWQLNKGWPTLLWDLYNYDYDEAGSYFGAKKANEDLHILYTYDTRSVTLDNLSGVTQPGLTVQSKVYSLTGAVLDSQAITHPIALGPQQVATSLLTPKAPAETTSPTPAQTYFVELVLRQHGAVVDRNVYWLSTHADVLNWHTTRGAPQANNGGRLSQYANMAALHQLPSVPVQVSAATAPATRADGGTVTTSVTITNPSANHAVAFFLRADVRRGNAGGTAAAGDNEVLPITWSDNDVTLWPGESQTLTARYQASRLRGATPVVSVYGWNTPSAMFPAPDSAAALAAEHAASAAPGSQHFGLANGAPRVHGTPRPGAGSRPGGDLRAGQQPAVSAKVGPRWELTTVADSPTTTPATSFTQGDTADTYTVTATNGGNAPTNGTTPVTLVEVLDPNISFVSASGTGWTCNTANAPMITCTETGGTGGGPAVLAPGQSYPPVTITVGVPAQTGFGSQGSTAGLHVTNAVIVYGGAAVPTQSSLASVTPIVGVPSLTSDDAVDGAFQQGSTGGRYELTMQNLGGTPTDGLAADPITATITAPPAGVTVTSMGGPGWTCSLTPVTAPQPEPADTCLRSDVLAGENGEEPPITVTTSVADNAPTGGALTVDISGGGSPAPPALVTTTTTIGQSADLTASSSHTGAFTQGDKADTYTLTVANSDGPNAPTTGGPSLGLVTLTDTLPWGLTATAMSGTGWTCDVATLTCYRTDALPPGAAYPPVTLTVSVAGNAPATLTNTVTVAGGDMTSGPGSSTSGGGQTGTDRTAVNQTGPGTPPPLPAPPALAVASTHSGTFTQGTTGIGQYTLTVSNGAAAGAASGLVVLSDTLPPGLTPVGISGAGWSCSLAAPTLPPVPAPGVFTRHGPPNTYVPQPTCHRSGTLAAGASFPPVTLAVAVADDTQASVTDSVTVTGDGMASPASASDTTHVGQLPALGVSSYPSAGGVPYAPFSVGGHGADTYHVTVANNGYAPTTSPVTFSVDLPPGLTPLSLSAGPGWSCGLRSVTCTTQRGTTLAAGQQDAVTLTVAVAVGTPPDVQPAMQASGGGQTPAAALDLTNDYSTATNGGEFTSPTYIAQRP